MKKELPCGWPQIPPIYDIEKSYLDNFENGPFFDQEIPERIFPPKEQWVDFLGFKVASPIGVPAGPLLNSKWVILAAKLGFDIVTYKTIRSKLHPAHPLPNMIYVDTKGELDSTRHNEVLTQAHIPPKNMKELAATNSFGIPSRDESFLLEDIQRANRELAPGQVMIVSVVGTHREGEDYIEDFVETARIALKAGAKIIEIDLSCPNVSACEGSLYTNLDALYEISSKVKQLIGEIPLIIKVGVIDTPELMKSIMVEAKRAGVDAICGINTVSMKVVNNTGAAALGTTRPTAGVCGGPIRVVAMDFIKRASKINRDENLGLTLMVTGGVCEAKHFTQFLEAGADIAMSAVGMMWDPFIAARYHRRNNG